MTAGAFSRSLVATLKQELMKAKQAAEYWELLATTDDLTGLHNRRMFKGVNDRIAERRSPNHESEVTLLFIDLDDFGKLNKKYGDDVGDDALRLLGQNIRKNIRSEDIAIRKGGDEFVILLIGTTPEQANTSVVERLQKMLDGELVLTAQGDTIPIRGSIGVFAYMTDISPLENLKNADALMRTQKQARKKPLAA